MLTQVSLYWHTNTIATSLRPHYDYRYTAMPRSGHYAGHEEPALLADDITAFFHAPRQGIDR